MSSRDSGQGFNWRQILVVGAPVAFSIAAVVTIYFYYSRNKRKSVEEEIHITEEVKKDKKTSAARPLSPEKTREQEEEEAARKWLLDKKAEANTCFTNKEYERAQELYTQLITTCSPLPGIRLDVAKIYHNRAVVIDKIRGDGYLENVRDDCSKAIEIDPKYVKARVRRAKACEEMGDVMACLTDWTVCSILQPELANSDPAFHRVDQLLNAHAKQIAIEKMKTHVVLLPSKVRIEEFSSIFCDSDFYTEASLTELYRVDTCRHSISVKPLSPTLTEPVENGTAATESVSDTANTGTASSSLVNGSSEGELRKCLEAEPFWQAAAQIRSRQYKSVVELTSQAIDTGCQVFKPYALLVRATFYLILEKIQLATEDVNLIIHDENTAPQVLIGALLRRACAKEAVEEFAAALEDFEMALNIDNKNHSIYLVRSKFYSSDENPNFDKALADIHKCLELRPDNNLAGRTFYAMLKYKLASTSQSQVDLEKVKRHLRETMKQFPNSPEPIALYAQVLMDVQEIREAIEHLDKAIKMDPDNGMLLVYRAHARHVSKGGGLPGQDFSAVSNPHVEEATAQALEEMEYAIRIDGQCRMAMELLATMYSQRGEVDKALKYLDMALLYVRGLQDMTQFQVLHLIFEHQHEINQELQSCDINPNSQNYLPRQQPL